MYCKNCNSDIGDFRYCTQCGADNGVQSQNAYEPYGATQNNYSSANVQPQPDQGMGSALASMVLGICSLAGVGGIITAILAIVFARNYSKHGNADSEIYAKVGRITGIISLILNILLIILVVLYFVLIVVMFSGFPSYNTPYYYF